MIWTPYDWLSKGYSFYMAARVVIDSSVALELKRIMKNKPNKSKPVLYKPLIHRNSR